MSAPMRRIEQCRCGRPLHPYWLREDAGGTPRVFAQLPIMPGPASVIWAADLGDVHIALGLQSRTLVHDVRFESDHARDRTGNCLRQFAPLPN